MSEALDTLNSKLDETLALAKIIAAKPPVVVGTPDSDLVPVSAKVDEIKTVLQGIDGASGAPVA